MTWEEAYELALFGRRVRMIEWVDRWLSYDGNWWLAIVHPLTRVEIERHVVRMHPESYVRWFLGEWTTEDVSVQRDGAFLLTLFPWIEPLKIEFTGKIDGSDYVTISGGNPCVIRLNPLDLGVKIRKWPLAIWSVADVLDRLFNILFCDGAVHQINR